MTGRGGGGYDRAVSRVTGPSSARPGPPVSPAVEEIDPRTHVEEAVAVLRAAWQPPRLRYAPEDLAWEFARPGWAAPRGRIARDAGGEPAAFAALIPRTVRFEGADRRAWLATFLAARPDRGLAGGALLVDEIRGYIELADPVVVFSRPGRVGDGFLRTMAAAGLRATRLAEVVAYGGLPPPVAAAPAVEAADDPDLLRFLAADRPGRLVRAAHDPAALAHAAADPRGRCWAVVRNARGEVTAAACASVTEAVGREGASRLATLSAVALAPGEEAAGLAALAGFAARRWADRVTAPFVTLPNPTGIPPAALRAAGLRAMPARWAPVVFAADPADPLLTAEATDLEVI